MLYDMRFCLAKTSATMLEKVLLNWEWAKSPRATSQVMFTAARVIPRRKMTQCKVLNEPSAVVKSRVRPV